MKSLIEKAKEIKVKSRENYRELYSKQDIELAVAWFKEEITTSQLVKARWDMKGKSTSEFGGKALYYVASILKQGIKNGDLEIKLKKEVK